MTESDAVEIFRKTGALLEGHFVLRSGRHSRQFFQCALALQKMPMVEKLGEGLSGQVRDLGATTVVAPAMGGLVIGQEVARQLGIRFIFVEKENNSLALRRGFRIGSGEQILIVEDVITQGGRVRETMDIVRKNGGDLVGVALVVDRSNGAVDLGVPTFSLLQMEVETFAPDNLPEDMKKLPPTHPGSK
jgi:orotate phosphoribosyltransferase